jgi:malate dehydrogenase (oxaloacetate-decarboxylating)(NADP+)
MSLSGRRISGFNPLQAVDIDAIEAQMKMAALDTLKGYSSDHYGTVKQYRETDYIMERNAGGYQVLREPAWNKGTCSRVTFPDWRIFLLILYNRYIIQP